MRIIRYIFTALTALLPLAAAGQNLNPTVEVSKTYEGKLLEVDKPQLKMAVPDSVYRFDLDFDYEVAETPYKGSYEFSPYSVEIAPAPVVHEFKTMYLNAGVGYQLHPVLDFVWSPEFKKPFRMNVYASHKSFVGNYWNMGLVSSGRDSFVADRTGEKHGYRTWFGYDMRSKAGVEGRYDWSNHYADIEVSYDGIHQKDNAKTVRFYNAVDVKAGFASKKRGEGVFGYGLEAEYRFGNDAYSYGDIVYENDVDVDLEFSYGIDYDQSFLVDVGYDMAMTGGGFVSGGADIDIHPRLLTRQDRWTFDMGLRLSKAFRLYSASDSYSFKNQMVYPEIKVEYMVVRDAMKAYISLTGDSEVVSYADMLGFNGRAGIGYGCGQWNILDVTDERLNASLGLQGRIGTRFSYNVGGGYANIGHALLESLYWDGMSAMPGLGYGAYDKWYANFDWLLDLKSVRFDGALEYVYAFNMPAGKRKGLFAPPALKGDVSVSYNWKKRIYASVDCEFSTARVGSTLNAEGVNRTFYLAEIPGYADLGVRAEYAMTRKLSFWLKGGNLLGMTIQRSVLFAERGPYFTAGVCLNL